MGSASDVTLHARVSFEDRDRACIQALFVTDPADDMEMIANKKDKLLDSAKSWILKDDSFVKWLNEDSSGLLWLHGDPGKGKTMLSIALVEELTKRIQGGETSLRGSIVYFFCDNQDDRRRSAPLILRGIIYQLLCQRPDLAVYLNNEYEKQREQLFSSRNSLQTLWRVLHSIVRNSDFQELYIILDALDECDIDSMDTLLALLGPYIDTYEDYPDQSDQKGLNCRIKCS